MLASGVLFVGHVVRLLRSGVGGEGKGGANRVLADAREQSLRRIMENHASSLFFEVAMMLACYLKFI
jgi:hypothetical protein